MEHEEIHKFSCTNTKKSDKTSLRDPKQARWGNNSRFERSFVPGIREIQWRGFLRCWISRNSSGWKIIVVITQFSIFPTRNEISILTSTLFQILIRSSEFYIQSHRDNKTQNRKREIYQIYRCNNNKRSN